MASAPGVSKNSAQASSARPTRTPAPSASGTQGSQNPATKTATEASPASSPRAGGDELVLSRESASPSENGARPEFLDALTANFGSPDSQGEGRRTDTVLDDEPINRRMDSNAAPDTPIAPSLPSPSKGPNSPSPHSPIDGGDPPPDVSGNRPADDPTVSAFRPHHELVLLEPSAGLAEPRDRRAAIAVFDGFSGANSHGGQVEEVIQEYGGFRDRDIQRVQVGGALVGTVALGEALDAGDTEALDFYIEENIGGFLDGTSQGIELILGDERSNVGVINQSQGLGPSRVLSNLRRTFGGNAEFQAQVGRSLGLSETATAQEFYGALVDRIGSVAEGSERIGEARERYLGLSERLAEEGIGHVVAAGNDGGLADFLQDLGVDTPEGFFANPLSNPYNTTVGAVDDRMTGSLADDLPANFTSRGAGAELAASGVEIDVGQALPVNGTSFAAPMVTAAFAQIQQRNPDLTPQQIEDVLLATARPLDFPDQVGVGVFDRHAALAAVPEALPLGWPWVSP